MHLPSITDCLAALAFPTIRLQRGGRTIFNGGILLAIGLLIATGLPVLSRLPWAEFAQEASDQAVAALHLLEITYVILTL